MSEIPSFLDGGIFQGLQVCLAVWQILKFEPIGMFIRALAVSCLPRSLGGLLQPIGVSPTFVLLQCFHGRLFKHVTCHVIRASEPMVLPIRRDHDHQLNELITTRYLGKDYNLERVAGNKLFIDEKMPRYFITDAIWASLRDMVEKARDTVFLKDYREVWEKTVVGRVMSFEEVLDSLILDNKDMKALDNEWLLPVSPEIGQPLLTILNLVGILLQFYPVHWVTPAFFSITSGVLDFFSTLRKCVYATINIIFCCAMHLVCDNLPYSMRRRVYAFGCWIDHLKPSNDIQLRIVRGCTISAVIAGGAKIACCNQDAATLVSDGPDWDEFLGEAAGTAEEKKTFQCKHFHIKCKFDEVTSKSYVKVSRDHKVRVFKIDIKSQTRHQFMKMSTFLSRISEHLSGSLECEVSSNKLRVRSLRESINCYVKNGYPPVYILQFRCASVV